MRSGERTIRIGRRGALGLLGTGFSLRQAVAQGAWPERPVRIIVPYPPGGAMDLMGRALAEMLGPRLGQPLIIENLPGGGTTVGAAAAKRAVPDGYTLFLTTSTTLAVAPALFPQLPYDPVRDFILAAVLAKAVFVLLTPKGGPTTLPALIESLKGRSDTVFGSAGPGSPQHIAFERLRRLAGIEAVHVPFRGTALALPELIAGRLTTMFCDIAPARELIRGGMVNVLAVTAPRRFPLLPEVPTMQELGFDGFDVAWQALAMPAGTPMPIVQRLSRECVTVLQTEDGIRRLEQLGLLADPIPHDRLEGFVAAEMERWGPIVRASGAKAD